MDENEVVYRQAMNDLTNQLELGNDLQILDVRQIEEFEEGHLPQATCIPLHELEDAMIPFDNEEPLFVYCRSGQRAHQAIKILENRGFEQLINVGGLLFYHGMIEK